MKKRVLIFSLICIVSLVASLGFGHAAFADDKNSGRELEFFAGGGLFRAGQSITVNNAKSTFGGWGGEARGGVDLPWGDKFGTSFSAAYRYADTENNGSTFTEDGTLNSIGVRAELYFGIVALGGGIARDWFKVHSLSTTQGTLDSTYSGTRPFVSASVNYNIKEVLRFGLGGDYSVGNLGGYKSNGWTLGLNVGLLL